MKYTMMRSVWLATIKGLAEAVKKKFPDAEILEGTFIPFEVPCTRSNFTETMKDFSHKNILVSSPEFRQFWLKFTNDDFPYDMPRFGDCYRNAKIEYFSKKLMED